MRGSTTTLSVHIRKTLLFLHTVHLHHNLVMFVCACDAGLPLFSAVEQLPHQPPCCCDWNNCVSPPLQLHRPVCHCRTCSMALCWLSDITCRLCANYTEMVGGGWSVICNVFLLFVCLFKMQVSVMPCMCTTHPWDLSSPLTLFPCYMKSVCCENTHTVTQVRFFPLSVFAPGRGLMLWLNNSWCVEKWRNSWDQRE